MSNVVELSKRGIRNETDLKRFIKNHSNAEPGQMVQAINISMMLDITSSNAAHHHRLDAGRLLIELRASVEAGGDNWWEWQKGKFKRSRKDMEKMMRLARSEDPEEAFEEERAKARTGMAKTRAKRGANVSSKEPSAVEDILDLIEALTDQEREQLRTACKERWSW